MRKFRLKPRWIKLLTGAAICVAIGVYAASNSWAAMCMVGYNNSKCNSKPTYNVPGDGSQGQGDNQNPNIAPDCERLGYSDRGAKPNTTLWPRKALKNGANNTVKWQCVPCTSNGANGDIVRDEKGYARYNCYLKCQQESEATNVNSLNTHQVESGPISDWMTQGTVDNSGAFKRSNVYREQFVRGQAACTTIGGTRNIDLGNGQYRTVPKLKFSWLTRNVCGKCAEQVCDGTEINRGCYYPCPVRKEYTLEDGTHCCNMKQLTSMNGNGTQYETGLNVPNTATNASSLWHTNEWTDKCYTTHTATAADGSTCYQQEPKTCADTCKEPDYGNGCDCVSKSCKTVADENNLTLGSVGEGIVVNTKVYHFENGDVEKINGTCYVKTGVGCSESNCYTVSKLVCPDGSNGKDDCSCGIGCPTGYYQFVDSGAESYKPYSDDYVDVEPYKEGGANKKTCVKLDSDDPTKCASDGEVQCYKYKTCSSIDSMLVAGGLEGCKCGNGWKEEPTECDFDTAKEERTSNKFHPQGTALGYGDETDVTCRKYDGVECSGPLDGPNSECKCYCGGSWYAEDETAPACLITTETENEDYTWYDKSYVDDETTPSNKHTGKCYRYYSVECPYYTTRDDETCACKCDSGTQIDGDGNKPDDDDLVQHTYTVDHEHYTAADGTDKVISCYDSGDRDCGSKTLTDEGCKDCSDYADEQSSSDCGCAKKVSQTVEHKLKGETVLTCYKCQNDDARTCEEAGYFSSNTTPVANGADDWWCELEDAGVCVAWKDGEAISCWKGKKAQSSMSLSPCPNNGQGYHNDECLSTEIKVNRCLHKCQERWQCISYQCPRFTESTCGEIGGSFDISKVSTCIKEGQGFCVVDGKYCKTKTEYNDGNCSASRDDE